MILAVDLEGTLISTAVSQFPRPGLRLFLERLLPLVDGLHIYTSVPEDRVRAVVDGLIAYGDAPTWFRHVPVVRWAGEFKRVHFVPGADSDTVYIMDDYAACIHPDDRSRWIPIPSYEPPFDPDDRELEIALHRIYRIREGLGYQ